MLAVLATILMSALPPACQVRPQPKRLGPSCLWRSERHTVACTLRTLYTTDAAEAIKKLFGYLTAYTSENKSFKNPLTDGNLIAKDQESKRVLVLARLVSLPEIK